MAQTLSEKTATQKEKHILKGEEGNVLIISLILLVLLTMLGISSTRTSSIDLQVAGNNMTYKRNLFFGEAAAFEAVQNMQETDLETAAPNWILPEGVTDTDIRDTNQWDTSFAGGKTAQTSTIDAGGAARYLAVSGGLVDTGESLDMTRTKIHEFSVYGRCDRTNGTSIVKMGYRKAY